MDLARAPRRAPLTARKKGSGYENVTEPEANNWFSIFTPVFCEFILISLISLSVTSRKRLAAIFQISVLLYSPV
jgi:hypothetical protein